MSFLRALGRDERSEPSLRFDQVGPLAYSLPRVVHCGLTYEENSMRRRDFLKLGALLPALGLVPKILKADEVYLIGGNGPTTVEDAFNLEEEVRRDVAEAGRRWDDKNLVHGSGDVITIRSLDSRRLLAEGRDYIRLESPPVWPAGRPILQFAPHVSGIYTLVVQTVEGETYLYQVEVGEHHVSAVFESKS